MRLAFAGLLLPLCALAQEFEVASVKIAPPWEPGKSRMAFRGGPGTADPTRVVIDNWPLVFLIMRAYDVNPFQIAGDVRGEERYSITAKIPEGTSAAQFHVMLQKLLADRFKLKLHRESREMPIYEMVIAKGGPKLKEHEGEPPVEDLNGGPPARDKNRRPIPPPNAWMMEAPAGGSPRGMHYAVAESMERFAKSLSRELRRYVADATGLRGSYDFVLSWTPGGNADPGPDSLPELIPAIQQQLGLRLESRRAQVEFIVIESVAKAPTEN